MKKGDIDKRIIEYVAYLIDNKKHKSEADYLKKLGFPLNKLSDAKNGKAGFRAIDIGIILINDNKLNANWVMTGEGNMILTNDKENSNSLIKETIDDLLSKNAELNREIGRLEEKLKEIKKLVPKEEDAICAIASGSDLEQ